MVSAKMVIGTIEGVDRPALATVLPNLTGPLPPARRRREPGHQDAALQGVRRHGLDLRRARLRQEEPVDRPHVDRRGGLEGHRASTKEAFKTLKETGLNFVGNVEGRDVFNGTVDVIVTDGFTGNVILKVSEALAEMVEKLLREEIKRTLQASVGFLLSRSAFRRFKQRIDYSEYGGAPLLGVKGCVIICHGRSSAKASRTPSGSPPSSRGRSSPRRSRPRSPSSTRAKRGWPKA